MVSLPVNNLKLKGLAIISQNSDNERVIVSLAKSLVHSLKIFLFVVSMTFGCAKDYLESQI